MKVLVLGAGIIGVTTAHDLAEAGHEVTLIERREGAALETSRANGGQLSACEVAPWAGPEVPWLVLKWLGRADAPFKLSLKLDPDQWRFLWRFLLRCRTSARLERIGPNLELALATRQRMSEIEAACAAEGHPISYDRKSAGILRLFHHAAEWREAASLIERMAQGGVAQSLLDPAQCVACEPALASAFQRGEIIGGIFSPDDGSGDAALFTQALVQRAQRLGVTFLSGVTVVGFEKQADRVHGVITSHGLHTADAVVIAAGVGSAALARKLGFYLPVYPLKGYSVTVPLEATAEAMPHVSITDEARKVVISRLGNRLRAAGKAEIAGYDLTLDPARARSVFQAVESLMPQIGPQAASADYWCGLRPMSPDGSPIIGAAPGLSNLYFNTGHGSLGWTLGAGSAMALTDLISAKTPQSESSPFHLSRFL